MRPIKVEFQAFGPYAGYEMVDFDAIAEKGLFLICGDTGIGKTMILDAITFALYGKSSGHGRDDFASMRCTNADFDISTFVKFEFENNGKFYLFERRLERKRKNLAASYNVMCKDEAGVWQPVFENAKEKALNELAVQIIGLEYDQFRQVIVLPQGQFEKLLTSNSDEKEKILTNIFGEEKWQGIAEQLYNDITEKKDKLKCTREKISNSLAEENCESVSELEELVQQKQRQLEELEEEYRKADYDKLIKDNQGILVISKRFEDMHNIETRIKTLEEQADIIQALEIKVDNAKRAEKVRGLFEEVSDCEDELRKRKKEEIAAVKNVKDAEEKAAEALKNLKNHIELEGEIEEKKKLVIQYGGKRSDYRGLDTVKEELNICKADEKKAVRQAELAKELYEGYTSNIVDLNKKYETLSKEHAEIFNAYIAGITGELAKDLVPGNACPVCGSTHHPNKAKASPNSISKSHVDAKKKVVDEQFGLLQDEIAKQTQAKEDYDYKNERVGIIHAQLVQIETKYEGMTANLVPGISSLSQLNSKINELNDAINDYTKDKTIFEEKEKAAREKLAEAAAKLEPAKKEIIDAMSGLEEAKVALARGIAHNNFASEEEAKKYLTRENELEEIVKNISDYYAKCKAEKENLKYYQDELKGIAEPDAKECSRIIDKATEAKSSYAEQRGIITNELARLSSKLKKLKSEGEGIDERIREVEEDFAFAKKLRGDSGTGLQRYVLGIMFSSVIKAANEMLELVHDGRYRLYRSDAKSQGSNKRGLELAVFDRNSGEHEGRSVSTLSGGEKFLVSLALSIGMSNVAQKSGIKIEALFIDEGFGSLDENSINDAMNILESIRKANGMVGIISHVQLLRDRIACKLQVEETHTGSHIVKTVG